MSSLVDQFLADDNEVLNQYTQPTAETNTFNSKQFSLSEFEGKRTEQAKNVLLNNYTSEKNESDSEDEKAGSSNLNTQQRHGSSLSNGVGGQSSLVNSASTANRKQLLQDFKRKYNFYNDTSSEEEQDQEEEEKENCDDDQEEQNDDNSDGEQQQQNEATENEDEEYANEERSNQDNEANIDNDQSEVEQESNLNDSDDDEEEELRPSQILKEASNKKVNSNQSAYKQGEISNRALLELKEGGSSKMSSDQNEIANNHSQNVIGVDAEEQKTKKQMSALEELRRKYQFSSSDEEDDDFWQKKPSQANQNLKPSQIQKSVKNQEEESDEDQILSPAFKSLQAQEDNLYNTQQNSSALSQSRKQPEQSVKSSLQNFLQQQRASYQTETNKLSLPQRSRKNSSDSDDSQSYTKDKNQNQNQISLEEEQRRRYEEREKEREITLQQQRQKMLELQQQQLMSLRSKVNFDQVEEKKIVNDNQNRDENRKQIIPDDNTSDSESDFYQLSEMHDSQRPSTVLPESNIKQLDKDEENELTFSQMQFQKAHDKDQVKLQIAQMNQLLDSSIQNYDKLIQVQPPLTDRSQVTGTSKEKSFHFQTEESINQSEPLVRNQNFINNEKRLDQEMTFNDLSDITSSSNYQLSDSAASSYQDAQALKNALSVKKQQSQLIKQQPPIHQSVIKEEDLEESQLLNDSSLSHSQNLNYLEHSQRNLDIHEGKRNEEKQTSSYLQSKLMNLKQATGGQYFQVSNDHISQSSNQYLHSNNELSSNQIRPKDSDERLLKARQVFLKCLIIGREKAEKAKALQAFKENKLVAFYQVKLQNAAMMVDKMSKFSRSFISLNSLSQIINKNRLRLQAKAFSKWNLNQTTQNNKTSSNDSKILELQTQLQQKDEEIAKMEAMFREYSSWKNKLEQIEQKMKSDCDYWKSSCEKMQRENEKLQREAIKLTQNLIESKKDTEAKATTIDSLQKKLKAANAKAAAVQLDTVEEVVCPNCKNSLEESQIFTGRASTTRRENSDEKQQVQARQEQQMQMIQDLSSKLSDLEKQVMLYRERVHYHESMEEELKRNIEQQVDVVLKMEEERLLLLRDSKEIKDRNDKLQRENEDFRAKVGEFEKELEDLQTLINEQQQEMKRQRDQEKAQDESLLNDDGVSEGGKIGVNKENKSSNLKKKTTTLTQKPKVKKSQGLKFQPGGPLKVGENSAIFSSSVKQQLQSDSSMMTNSVQITDTSMISATTSTFGNGKSKYGQEPINKQLVTDNQLLTNELVMMGRELTKLKSELRGTQDQLKKTEKERYELRKNLDGKETAVEKLRKERDELWAVVNTDKYKNIKVIEQEKEKIEKGRQEAEQHLQSLREDLEKATKESDSLRLKLEELEFSTSKMKEKEAQREKLLESLEERARKSEIELSHQRQSTQTLLDELDQARAEGTKLKKDVDWLANSAKNNKLQAERAISDLESYTKILRGMEKKLAEVEVEKESKEAELKEMKIKIAAMQQIQQQQSMQQQIQVQVPHPQQMNIPPNYNQMSQQTPLTNQFIQQQQQYQVNQQKQNPNGNFINGVGNMSQQQPFYPQQYPPQQQPQYMNPQMRQAPINQNQMQQPSGQNQNYGIQKTSQNPQGQAPRAGVPQPQQPPQRFL